MTTVSTNKGTTSNPTAPAEPDRPRWQRPLTLALALAAAIAAAAIALEYGGAVDVVELPGLSTADPAVSWASGFLKLGGNLAAAIAVGFTIAAAFLIPGRDNAPTRLNGQGWRWLRLAAIACFVWAAILLTRAPIDYADSFARPLNDITSDGVRSYLTQSDQGKTLLLAAALALLAGIIAATTLSVSGAMWAGVVALAAALPPVFTGHSASAGNHQIAIDSMLLHVIGAVVWLGGLVALFVARHVTKAERSTDTRQPGIGIHVAARRYSALAMFAFVVVAASGFVNFVAREPLSALFDSSYGLVALAKVVGLTACGVAGWWHRRRTLPLLWQGKPRAFARFAGVEIIILAATFGVASALAVTPPPGEESGATDPTVAILGYELSEPFSWGSILTTWYPNILFTFLGLMMVGFYLAGVWRLRQRGDAWSPGRTVAWVLGWALAWFVTSSGIGKYAMAMFSVHMVQHMALNMAAPILIVLGAPVTLALRALRPNRSRGAREWILSLVHSRFAKIVSQPLVALMIYLSSLYVMYFTSLFEWAMSSHVGHIFMLVHFLGAGCLFFWVIIGPDPKPHRLSYPAKVLIFFISLVFHAIFGLTLMMTTQVIAEPWYLSLSLEWNADLLDDQQTGGGIAWAFGEIPALLVLGALLSQWAKSDEREGRRLDRMATRAAQSGKAEDDPHEVYNAYLAKLAEQDRQRDEQG